MRYLVLGGAGFIGRTMVEKLTECPQNEVVVIDNFSTSPPVAFNTTAHVIREDIQYCHALEEWIKWADVVYFLAGSVGVMKVVAHPYETAHNNMSLAMAVMPLVKKHDKYVIFTSTSEVYGQGPYEETAPLSIGSPDNLRWIYASTKLTTEFMVASSGCRYKIYRPFNVTGPGQPGTFGMVIPRFVAAALAGADIEVYGNGYQRRTFCHASDAVDIMMSLERVDENGVFNVGTNDSGNAVSITELANIVKHTLNSPSNIVIKSYDQVFVRDSGDIANRIPNMEKVTRTIKLPKFKSLHDIITEIAGDQMAH